MDKIERIGKLFRGLERAHGEFREKSDLRKSDNKVQGSAKTVEGEVTRDHWAAHLAGEYGVGVVPITDAGTCTFAAIDFDNYNEYTVKRFVIDAKKSGFPFVWCKSKSGGAHLYMFFAEPIAAADVRKKLGDLARALGYPKIEIFPKQETLEPGQIGNWINLPYFNEKYTARYGFDDNSQPISECDAFLDYAESKLVLPEDFEALKVVSQEIPFSDAPPCIQQMAHAGIADGERNKSLFQFAIYAKKKHPEDWEAQVLEWNGEYFAPGLPYNEVKNTIFKSLAGDKEYGYLCKEPVCSEVCNKPLCQTREFGIMGGLVQVWDDWNVEGVRKLVQVNALGEQTDDPPRYIISINGNDVNFSRPELTSNMKFREKVFEKLDKMPPRMNNNMWDQMIQHWLINHTVVEIPYELTETANLGTFIKDFIEVAPEAQTRLDVRNGMVLFENGAFLFHFEAFSKFLQQHKYPVRAPNILWNQLRALGIEKKTTTATGNVKLNYWVVQESFVRGEGGTDHKFDAGLEF
jgi:hypothetical protein